MTKKLFFITAIFVAVSLVVNAADDFAQALKDCTPFTGSGSVTTEGMNVDSTKRILGWQGDRCVYKESVKFSGINAVVTCKLSKPQITEFLSVANAYSLLNNYSTKNVDTSSLSAVEDNPVVKVWSKFLQDPNTCSMSGIDGFSN